MKKRYLYSILYGIPGLFISLLIASGVFATVAGILWVFVYGDEIWPTSLEIILPALFITVFLLVWVTTLMLGYTYGKKHEGRPAFNFNHVWISIMLTILPVTLIIFHQTSVGNIGTPPDGKLCSDFCFSKGFSGSGMPPADSGEETCSCYDSDGEEVIKVSVESISSDTQGFTPY